MEEQNLPDHQHTAEGILLDLRAHELEREVDIRGLLILYLFMQVTSGEDDIVEQSAALGDFSLETRLAQVLGAGLHDLLLMVLNATENVNSSFTHH